MRATLFLAAAVATASLASLALPLATACIQPCQPPVYLCVNGVRGTCPNGHDVCFGILSSPYQCEDVPPIGCADLCQLPDLVTICNQPNACWGHHDHCIEVGGGLVEPTPFCWDDLD